LDIIAQLVEKSKEIRHFCDFYQGKAGMFGRLYNNFQAAEAVLFKNAGHSRIPSNKIMQKKKGSFIE